MEFLRAKPHSFNPGKYHFFSSIIFLCFLFLIKANLEHMQICVDNSDFVIYESDMKERYNCENGFTSFYIKNSKFYDKNTPCAYFYKFLRGRNVINHVVNELDILKELDNINIVNPYAKTGKVLKITGFNVSEICYISIYKILNGEYSKKKVLSPNHNNFNCYKDIINCLRNILLLINCLHKNNIMLFGLNYDDILVHDDGNITLLNLLEAKFINSDGLCEVEDTFESRNDKYAPEIKPNGIISTKVDVYSFGYIMEKIWMSFFKLDTRENLSDLIKLYNNLKFRCLKKDFKTRISVDDALKHPIFDIINPKILTFHQLKDFEYNKRGLIISKIGFKLYVSMGKCKLRCEDLNTSFVEVSKDEDSTFYLLNTYTKQNKIKIYINMKEVQLHLIEYKYVQILKQVERKIIEKWKRKSLKLRENPIIYNLRYNIIKLQGLKHKTGFHNFFKK